MKGGRQAQLSWSHLPFSFFFVCFVTLCALCEIFSSKFIRKISTRRHEGTKAQREEEDGKREEMNKEGRGRKV
jgi:flagellar biosynthesis/type III secretory pathway M-ring protein FliF/YscJ